MKPSLVILKSVRVSLAKPEVPLYQIPALLLVLASDLPNNGFGNGNYNIQKTKFQHWPVYVKIQNTKIQTEIKRIKGDVIQFKKDLLKLNPNLDIAVNNHVGYVNIKGDRVEEIKTYFDKYLN